MNGLILNSVLILGGIGAIGAVILYIVAEKFKVYEDPRIDTVEALLPSANCGGCGFAGCRNFAETIVKNGSLEGLLCPPGGNPTMSKIAEALGMTAEESDAKMAVVRCNGSCQNAPAKSSYDGVQSCTFVNSLFAGDNGCRFGCLGCGDCVKVCNFDAIYIDEQSGLPVVKDNCVACGACVKACPRSIIELRNRGNRDMRVFVSCVNKEKGGMAKKNCAVACIGCGKCQKACPFDAITINNNLAYIDFKKCKLCRKCISECPTSAIHDVNFPNKKEVDKIEVETINN